MTTLPYFPAEPFDGVVSFDGPGLHLAAVQQKDYPMADMPRLMDGTFSELYEALEGIGATVCGPALALHTRVPTDTVDIAVGVPVTAPLDTEFDLSTGFRVVATPCPAGQVAATSYLGSYDGLGEAWGAFVGNVGAAGHTPTTTFLEVYVSNPAEVTDPATLRTDLIIYLV